MPFVLWSHKWKHNQRFAAKKALMAQYVKHSEETLLLIAKRAETKRHEALAKTKAQQEALGKSLLVYGGQNFEC